VYECNRDPRTPPTLSGGTARGPIDAESSKTRFGTMSSLRLQLAGAQHGFGCGEKRGELTKRRRITQNTKCDNRQGPTRTARQRKSLVESGERTDNNRCLVQTAQNRAKHILGAIGAIELEWYGAQPWNTKKSATRATTRAVRSKYAHKNPIQIYTPSRSKFRAMRSKYSHKFNPNFQLALTHQLTNPMRQTPLWAKTQLFGSSPYPSSTSQFLLEIYSR